MAAPHASSMLVAESRKKGASSGEKPPQNAPAAAATQGPLPGDPFAAESPSSLPGDPFAAESPDSLRGDPFGNGDAQAWEDPFQDFDESVEEDTENGLLIDIHGYLEHRTRFRAGFEDKAEFISNRQRLWLEVTWPPLGSSLEHASPVRAFASGALDMDLTAASLSDDHDPVRPHLEEAYLTLDTQHVDVLLGRKMVRWGTGDGINPMDLINPIDFRDPISSGRADSRVPVVLAQIQARLPTFDVFQEASFEAVMVPLAAVNRLNASGSSWEGEQLRELRRSAESGQFLLADQEQPDHIFEDAEFGARLAVTFSGWDLALIGFHGFQDSPVFERRNTYDPVGDPHLWFFPIHPRFNAIGLNFAKGLDHSTVRGELALKPDKPLMLDTPSSLPGWTRRPVIEGVLGMDRTFGVSLYTNVQYFFSVIGGETGPLAANAFDHGVSYEIHDDFLNDDLEAGIRGIASFSEQGATIEPYAEYKLGDNWLLAASLFFFEGPIDGSYGQYTKNDFLTLRLRYSF